MNKALLIMFFSGSLLAAGAYVTNADMDRTGRLDRQPPPGEPGEQYSGPAFIFVEDGATFQGGDLDGFREWVQENIVYPQEDLDNNVFGRVTVQFVVDPQGKTTDVVILRGVTPTINEETRRVILSSPDWEPARLGGRNVAQQFTIPVYFTLTE